jgi:hypothetical protein
VIGTTRRPTQTAAARELSLWSHQRTIAANHQYLSDSNHLRIGDMRNLAQAVDLRERIRLFDVV